MSDAGQELAIKRVGYSWRVYEIQYSERFGAYGKVLRGDDGQIRNFGTEAAAREYIETMPDATEMEYPA
jgi:hypothetical protein